MKLSEFLQAFDSQLVIRSRNDPSLNRFYACVERVEIKDGPFLKSVMGQGAYPEAAVRDLCKRLSGEHLVKNAWSSGCPRMDFGPVQVEIGDFI